MYLHSEETFFPGPIADQLAHTRPQINFTNIAGQLPADLNLNDLSLLNAHGGENIALTSRDDFTRLPAWLHGTKPDQSGRVAGQPSSAILTRALGNGTLFAFYMFFYPFNYVPIQIGLHVGDWEHFALRFDDQKPTQAWFSQHAGGKAYAFDALEKQGQRPLVFSGNGTHANYATVGNQTGIPGDKTDKGFKWDPILSAYLVQVQPANNAAHGTYTSYQPGVSSSSAPRSVASTDWLYYLGIWGDPQLLSNDPRQHGSGLATVYTSGPTGPQDKDLDRNVICPGSGRCDIQTSIP